MAPAHPTFPTMFSFIKTSVSDVPIPLHALAEYYSRELLQVSQQSDLGCSPPFPSSPKLKAMEWMDIK